MTSGAGRRAFDNIERWGIASSLANKLLGNNMAVLDPEALRQFCRKEFRALLDRARQVNQLYFLLNLFNVWGIHAPLDGRAHAGSMDFIVDVNGATNSLILDKIRDGRRIGILPHEALFVLQLNFEAKAFYAVVRNFVSLCEGRRVSQEPWLADEFKPTGLSTTVLIRNLCKEIRGVSSADFADCFDEVHLRAPKEIRHAVAHGTFRLPTPATGDKWVFGNYVGRPPSVHLTTWAISHSEFMSVFQRFLAVRLGILLAIQDVSTEIKSQSFSFQAANQMDRAQILDCRYTPAGIEIKYQGTPLW